MQTRKAALMDVPLLKIGTSQRSTDEGTLNSRTRSTCQSSGFVA